MEYRVVFVCGLDKEIFPIERNGFADDDTEEERRLMYVAVTRARERLYITRARSRFLYGSRRPTVQSEFLDEIADKIGMPKADYGYGRYQDINYTAGAKVLHKKFGEGIIVARKLNGDDVVIDVAFKGVGIKSLVVRYAPIEVIK